MARKIKQLSRTEISHRLRVAQHNFIRLERQMDTFLHHRTAPKNEKLAKATARRIKQTLMSIERGMDSAQFALSGEFW